MNQIYDELNRVLDDAGVPKIVRERCPWCGGAGKVYATSRGNRREIIFTESCSACAGNGFITVEAA